MFKLSPEAEERVWAVFQQNRSRGMTTRVTGHSKNTVRRIVNERLALEEAARARPVAAPVPKIEAVTGNFAAALAAIRKAPLALEEVAAVAKSSNGQALDWLESLKGQGRNVHKLGDRYSIEKDQPVASSAGGPAFEYVSRPDNTFLFGAMGDTHLGSKYERLDCLDRLYDRYVEERVDRVFHTGNWIDGEARFNKFDLLVHGMDAQICYLAEKYPRRPGIVTYAVAGDDHEGWYAQREGVNIGKYAENAMKDAGRTDWVDMGYMEARVNLVNANTGKSAVMGVVHPGGGSSYALSYSIQKIVEGYDGGEKPAVGIFGHYHKLWAGNIRNVWVVQTGCTVDQGTFMRKFKLEAHVGGAVVKLKQDPETGAIVEMTPTLIRYFNKAYYGGRWSHSGPVVLPERG